MGNFFPHRKLRNSGVLQASVTMDWTLMWSSLTGCSWNFFTSIGKLLRIRSRSWSSLSGWGDHCRASKSSNFNLRKNCTVLTTTVLSEGITIVDKISIISSYLFFHYFESNWLLLGHTWQFSGITSGPETQESSLAGSRIHMGFKTLNSG